MSSQYNVLSWYSVLSPDYNLSLIHFIKFIHFPPLHLHYHQFSSIVTHPCLSISSISIHFIHFYPFPSTVIHVSPFLSISSISIHFHPPSSIFINFITLSIFIHRRTGRAREQKKSIFTSSSQMRSWSVQLRQNLLHTSTNSSLKTCLLLLSLLLLAIFHQPVSRGSVQIKLLPPSLDHHNAIRVQCGHPHPLVKQCYLELGPSVTNAKESGWWDE